MLTNKLRMIGRNNKWQFQQKTYFNLIMKIRSSNKFKIIMIHQVLNNKTHKNLNNYKYLKVLLKMLYKNKLIIQQKINYKMNQVRIYLKKPMFKIVLVLFLLNRIFYLDVPKNNLS